MEQLVPPVEEKKQGSDTIREANEEVENTVRLANNPAFILNSTNPLEFKIMIAED